MATNEEAGFKQGRQVSRTADFQELRGKHHEVLITSHFSTHITLHAGAVSVFFPLGPGSEEQEEEEEEQGGEEAGEKGLK